MLSILAAALAVLPSFVSGQSGELLIRTDAPEVVLLVNDRLDGASGCYAVIRGPLAWARDQRSGVWVPGGGWPCRVTSAKNAEGLRVGIEFDGNAVGMLSVFVQTRPGGSRWYRAGKWEVTGDGVAALPPAAIAGPPEREKAPPASQSPPAGETCELLATTGVDWHPGYPVVYRNGLRLWAGLDYEFTAERVRPLPTVKKWNDDDVVIGCGPATLSGAPKVTK